VAVGDVDGDGDLDLVCGNRGESNTLYQNTGGVFSLSAVWSSVPTNATSSVALGDIDGDGDLDLVCGNFEQANTLYENIGGTFSDQPVWSSDSALWTKAVALGDIDGDGDLDLVCGNTGQSNTIYENRDGVLSTSPVWSSDSTYTTWSVTLGDVDGDGDLDLVCGNVGQGNTLYENTGGTFSTSPVWSSNPTNFTQSVVLGDIDGDGDLDLACGNFGQGNTFYENTGTSFTQSTVWASAPRATSSVALGDVDADGDLDLVCGNYGQSNTVYENAGGPSSMSLVWSSNPTSFTRSVVLGDMDGDGDLDLVCGNTDQRNSVYENQGDKLSGSPAWLSDGANSTSSVALGDVDGDGDFDLVCGNYGQGNTLYENVDGVLATSPKWTSVAPHYFTRSVALGDVDGDGDLDLVCGNYTQPITLHENTGETFSTTPVWLSADDEQTYDVALADLGDDGNLDLVCGGVARVAVYENRGGGFSPRPAWTLPPPAENVSSVVLGDVDGDGDLDLVCGRMNYFGLGLANVLFLNTGAWFSTSPLWTSTPTNYTNDVALGDIDGDGDLDLVCANQGGRGGQAYNTVYENTGGTFTASPVWSSIPGNTTSHLALGDVDGDGDLDLACGNKGQANNTLYINLEGVFTRQPMWSSAPTNETWGAALSDINGDGDLDLVCGNTGQESSMYQGTSNPPFAGDPVSPTHHLANNCAYVSHAGVTAAGTNHYTVDFTVHDVEPDRVWIVADYQLEGSPWRAVELVGGGNPIGPLATTPEGVDASFDWDVTRLAFDFRNVVLRLRTIEIPQRVSTIQHASSYRKSIGPIVPIRPQITTSSDSLSFAAITAGDTTSLQLIISNTGTADLTITDVETPSVEMRIDGTWPLTVTPGERDTSTVYLEPRHETDVSGFVQIMSDDPLTPIDSIQVTTDIIALEVSSKLLNPAEELPLGDAVSVLVIPAPRVSVESGRVYHRPTGQAEFVAYVSLLPFEGDFMGVIPGEAVTEAGLDYCVQVENSGVFATDPAEAPDSFYSRSVAAPEGMASDPIPHSGQDFLADREIKVRAILPQGAEFVWGALHYRPGGAGAYAVDSLVMNEVPEAAIPSSVVGETGVEYWVEVQTLKRRLTDPAVDPSSRPYTIPVNVQDLIEPYRHAGGETVDAYRLVSIPLQFGVDFTGTIEALLSDQPEFGLYDRTRWRSWVYLPGTGSYGELSDASMAVRFRPQPGRAWWLISRDPHRISTAPVAGKSIPTDGPYPIELAAESWNVIGCPFAFSVSWDSIRVDTLTMAEAIRDTVVSQPWGWDKDWTPYVVVLKPFDGCWVYNHMNYPVTLWVKPEEMPAPIPQAVVAHGAEFDGWHLSVTATSGGISDVHNAAGISAAARAGLDRYDRVEPPPLPDGGLALYFLRFDKNQRLATDVRPLSTDGVQWGAVWAFDIAKQFSNESGGDEVTVAVRGFDDLPTDARAVLVDRKLDRRISIGDGEEYSFYLGRREYVKSHGQTRFRLIVGTESFVREAAADMVDLPTKTALYQNYPNPFNPATVIRYEVAQAGQVAIRIYNVRGALVKTLYDGQRKPGRYEVGWNGRNRRGEPVSSGVYFYRMETPGFVETRKMVLLR
jgi:hypothetical protein